MDISNIIVQGGLTARAAQDYQEEQDSRAYTRAQRGLGLKKMAAEEELLPGNTEAAKLRQQIEQNELRFQQATQPQEQEIRRSDVAHRGVMQPGQQALDKTNQQVAQGTADQAKALLPGQTRIAEEGQNVQLQGLKEQQIANLWSLLKTGDTKGTLDMLNNSKIIFPGRQFSNIQRGTVPVRGNDGKPLVQDGKPVTEDVLQFVPADGGRPEFAPVRALEALSQKHGTKFEKVGNNLVKIDRTGTVTPAYEPDQFAANPETGGVFNKRTGLPPAANGVPGAGGGKPSRKEVAHTDDRVKMAIDKVILPKFGGRFEGGMFFPDEKNKDVALRAQVLTESLIRQNGMDPVAAANQAIAQAEREKAVTDTGGSPGGGTPGYSGPTPWK